MPVWNSAGLTTLCSARECSLPSHAARVLNADIPRPYARIYDQYSFSIIPLLGTILAGDRASYQYLVESIRKFPPQPEFAKMIQDAGFTTGALREGKGGAWTDLWDGIACIHTGDTL